MVLEHVDTNSFTKSPSPIGHDTEILEKGRPPGRSSNPRVTRRSLSLKKRDPVNFGRVGGASHPLPFSWSRSLEEYNDRSSRRGKEQIKSRTSGGGARK